MEFDPENGDPDLVISVKISESDSRIPKRDKIVIGDTKHGAKLSAILDDRQCFKFTKVGNLSMSETLLSLQSTGECKPGFFNSDGTRNPFWRVQPMPQTITRRILDPATGVRKRQKVVLASNDFCIHGEAQYRELDGPDSPLIVDYKVLPNRFLTLDHLDAVNTDYGRMHSIELRPMARGICWAGCGFSYVEEPGKRHDHLVYQPKEECVFSDFIEVSLGKKELVRYCSKGCGTIVKKGSDHAKGSKFHDCVSKSIRGFELNPELVRSEGLHYDNLEQFTDDFIQGQVDVNKVLDGSEEKMPETLADRLKKIMYRDELAQREALLAVMAQAEVRKHNVASIEKAIMHKAKKRLSYKDRQEASLFKDLLKGSRQARARDRDRSFDQNYWLPLPNEDEEGEVKVPFDADVSRITDSDV